MPFVHKLFQKIKKGKQLPKFFETNINLKQKLGSHYNKL